ncbi:unnamed protein product [Parascedosporium putredinis]|uniref:O-methyltransferase C-terminal domain-containing protein n=1 Tax=Parascedosporium putredinis TaxID=1442378 RepID=A0A9P1H2D8_9PEZI|nr:unnamed protein product [Parascedosporium putredinis]CAI7993515.1 unnamed protein product [Parascedosporium putredinis]
MASISTEQQPKPQGTTLTELAAKVTELTQTFTTYLQENNIPEPTFSADSPTNYATLSPEMFMVRQHLTDALNDMWYLTQGPSESIFNYVHSVMPDAAALNVLNYFDFWSAVPLDGTASYADFAAHTHLPHEVVYRVLQHAVTLRLFEEVEPGRSSSRLRHTSRSAALVRNPGLKALVSTILDDAGAPLMVLNEALARYSKSKPELTQEVTESAFALFHKSGIYGNFDTSWELIENDGEGERKGWRQRNFVEFMKYVKEIFRLEETVSDSFDWAGAGDAMVVDTRKEFHRWWLRRKRRLCARQKFPNLRFTVEDLPEVQPVFNAALPAELADRVSFIPHNFFDDQPVQGDIYMFKMIFHDWPDHEVGRILRALKPSLKPGAQIILLEYIGNQGETDEPDASRPQLPRSYLNMGTATDLRLMALFNGKERAVSEWEKVIRDADPGFRVSAVNPDAQSFFTVIRAVWEPVEEVVGQVAEAETQAAVVDPAPAKEAVATEAVATEAKPIEATLTQGTPAETTPAEAAPLEVAPAEPAPVEVAPVEATPVEPAPAEIPVADAPLVEAAPAEPQPADPTSIAALSVEDPPLSVPSPSLAAPASEQVAIAPETFVPVLDTPAPEARKDSVASDTASDTSVRTPTEQENVVPPASEDAKVGNASNVHAAAEAGAEPVVLAQVSSQ